MEDKRTEKNSFFQEFFRCSNCGKIICSDKKSYFTCQVCGRALCEKSRLADFNDNYCGNCGADVASAKKIALAKEENQQ